ncbi:hypothetical protein K0G46_05585 [Phocaeicola vulgatus]|uniref:hypothetical protein n=1 Tax=Phocaeicola TaxID=909656 RepID=UPI0011C122DD|nr:hypothetical protein [Phocaeicola vulgatus]MCE9190991.1 hypothetical protein [Phocaeicola vulgatus]
MSNSKDTLLISREINNPSANGLEFVLLFRLSKHRFPMPILSPKRIGKGGAQVAALVENVGNESLIFTLLKCE